MPIEIPCIEMAYSEYMRGEEMLLSVAPTDNTRIDDETTLPTTPESIAGQVADCADLGASVATVHGWTPEGKPTPTALPTVSTAIRDQTPEILVEYAVGPECPLGDYVDVLEAGPDPDLAQVRITPTQYGSRGSTRRTRKEVDRFLRELRSRHIKPHLLLQSGRDIQELHRVLEADILNAPVVTLRVGAREGTVASPMMLVGLLEAMPSSATVFVAATGPNQYPLTTMAVFLGVNVRVGMGDNRYLSREEPVSHNVQLVQRVAEVVHHSERSLAVDAAELRASQRDVGQVKQP